MINGISKEEAQWDTRGGNQVNSWEPQKAFSVGREGLEVRIKRMSIFLPSR